MWPFVFAAVTAILLPALSGDGERMTFAGRTTVASAERTDAGEWAGTWFYVSKSRKMALWIRDDDGLPQVKLRLNEKGSDIVTDWNGQGEYVHGGRPGKLSLDVTERDENTISGRWNWTFGTEQAGRRESADFAMFRAGRGRSIVMRIENWSTETWGGSGQRLELPLQIWSFHKASRRQALWGELPF